MRPVQRAQRSLQLCPGHPHLAQSRHRADQGTPFVPSLLPLVSSCGRPKAPTERPRRRLARPKLRCCCVVAVDPSTARSALGACAVLIYRPTHVASSLSFLSSESQDPLFHCCSRAPSPSLLPPPQIIKDLAQNRVSVEMREETTGAVRANFLISVPARWTGCCCRAAKRYSALALRPLCLCVRSASWRTQQSDSARCAGVTAALLPSLGFQANDSNALTPNGARAWPVLSVLRTTSRGQVCPIDF